MSITQENYWEGRKFTFTWHDSDFVPPRNLVTQAYGICFTDDSRVVLVTKDGEDWHIPGGRPYDDETIEEAFIREVREEACARVFNFEYLGAQEVNDPENPEGLTTYYQVRFWARIRLDEYKPEHEMTGRKLVEPSIINDYLKWSPTRILKVIIEKALDCEHRFKKDR
jgi:ADP-ribose pyrophosphatase YjhB (NUDIX family)